MGLRKALRGMLLAKRHIMNEAAVDHGCSVLATAHNLDDEAALLMLNTMRRGSYLSKLRTAYDR